MKVYTEKEAEGFLEKRGFEIVKRIYIKKKSEIKDAIKKIGFPVVMKVSGKKIIHKNKVMGVKTNIKSYEQSLKAFDKLLKIKNCEGIMVQRQIEGKEFLLGIKKTPEFGHVVAFGAGGIYTEKFKDVSFRVCPFDKTEVKKMMKEVKVAERLSQESRRKIEKNLIKLCWLVEKYSKIKELDINPLIVGFLAAGGVSAAFSTVSGLLVAGSSAFAHDL